jgi:hypothetical protein
LRAFADLSDLSTGIVTVQRLSAAQCANVERAIAALVNELYAGKRRNGGKAWLARVCDIDRRDLSRKPTRALVAKIAAALSAEHGVTVEGMLSGNPLPGEKLELRRFGAIRMAKATLADEADPVMRGDRERILAMLWTLENGLRLPGWRNDGYGTATLHGSAIRFSEYDLEAIEADCPVGELEAQADAVLARYRETEAAEISRARRRAMADTNVKRPAE